MLAATLCLVVVVTSTACDDPVCKCDGQCGNQDAGVGIDGTTGNEAGTPDKGPAPDQQLPDAGADQQLPDISLPAKCGEFYPCPAGYCCDTVGGKCYPCPNQCIYKPKVGDFKPTVEWRWKGPAGASDPYPSHSQIMMAPLVANFTDDNNDGKIDTNDTPDVLVNTFEKPTPLAPRYGKNGRIRVLSGDTGKEHAALNAKLLKFATFPAGQMAVGDIDNDGRPELVACKETALSTDPKFKQEVGIGVYAINDDGSLLWESKNTECHSPVIADINGDGKVEVVSCYAALEGATGKLVSGSNTTGCHLGMLTTVADLDADKTQELVGADRVVTFDTTKQALVTTWQDKTITKPGYVAVADLDGDKTPEIVVARSSTHMLYTLEPDGKPHWKDAAGKRKEININRVTVPTGVKPGGGGPPTVADFDGDGKPEIGVAGGFNYLVVEHDGTYKWHRATKDQSSRATGSSVFDFEGDGKAEVVYGDEQFLRIYDGATGKEKFKACSVSGTLRELPVIADVDNDGHAEIVVVSNNYAKALTYCAGGTTLAIPGVTVYGDAKNNWVKTRRIWNQHAYSITNVEEDGTIPKVPEPNWKNPHLNNFRQNLQPLGIFDAPDLVGVSLGGTCGTQLSVQVRVDNLGMAKVVAGVPVSLFIKESAGKTLLKTVETKTTITPGASEKVTLAVTLPTKYQGKTLDLVVEVDDDGKGNSKINECKEANNTVKIGTVKCP